jgi:hypothetical protein
MYLEAGISQRRPRSTLLVGLPRPRLAHGSFEGIGK